MCAIGRERTIIVECRLTFVCRTPPLVTPALCQPSELRSPRRSIEGALTTTADTLSLASNLEAATVHPVIKGHAAWASLATPPEGVTFTREEGKLAVREFQDVIRRSDLNCPVDDLPRLTTMLAHANLVVTARDNARRLIGVARSLTDFAYCCYLSDLCVDEAWQGRGIGRALVAETKSIVGPNSMVVLLSAPKPMGYYHLIGMDTVQNGFIIRREG